MKDCNDNLKEPESTCSSEQAAEEFTKENSPFFLVGGSPSLWVTRECSQHSVTECLASAYHEEPEEGKRGINAGKFIFISGNKL